MNRRMFLTGAGTTLTIPFLGSLVPARAATQAPRATRFVAMATQHGGIWGEHMWPADSTLTETLDIGHTVRRGDLASATVGSQTVLSDVLTGDSSRLTASVVSQLNLLRGLDIPFYMSHHTGGHLGNFGRNDQEFDGSSVPYIPTIDQLMAWSSAFYDDLGGVVQRSVHVGERMSYGWSNPTSQSGSVTDLPGTTSSLELFDSLFPGGGGPQEGPPRRLVVDKVLASYQRLRDGAFGPARRLSAGDRQRLDEHVERLFEVERALLALPECDEVDRPDEDTQSHPGAWGVTSLDDNFAYHQLWNEVLALGLICGATRIATLNCYHEHEPYEGDWHQEVAHEAWVSLDAEQRLVRGHGRFFDEVFCDLANRLDVPDADGNTVLFNSLMMWTQESGPMTHDFISTPTIVAGSAGGAVRTGQYCDYRNLTSMALVEDWHDNAVQQEQRPGLLYGQYLASALQLCGLDRSEWEIANNPGYGVHDNQAPEAYPAYVEALGNDLLPFLS